LMVSITERSGLKLHFDCKNTFRSLLKTVLLLTVFVRVAAIPRRKSSLKSG
jgi:hypothetical protein